MRLDNQVVDIVDNLILRADGSVFALYEVAPEIMNPVAFTKKEQLKATVESWLSDIKPYGDFDIAMLPFPKDLLGKFRELSEKFAEDTEEMAFSVLEK
ncbi:conjugal transfer protein, partial [Streptococcus sanguinis]|nr:conjugal transfer protein [Streptococcus sanguinis]